MLYITDVIITSRAEGGGSRRAPRADSRGRLADHRAGGVARGEPPADRPRDRSHHGGRHALLPRQARAHGVRLRAGGGALDVAHGRGGRGSGRNGGVGPAPPAGRGAAPGDDGVAGADGRIPVGPRAGRGAGAALPAGAGGDPAGVPGGPGGGAGGRPGRLRGRTAGGGGRDYRRRFDRPGKVPAGEADGPVAAGVVEARALGGAPGGELGRDRPLPKDSPEHRTSENPLSKKFGESTFPVGRE